VQSFVDNGTNGSSNAAALSIELVDEKQMCMNTITLCLSPYIFALGLNTLDPIQHNDGSVNYSNCALNFDSKVHVSWRVDKGDSDR